MDGLDLGGVVRDCEGDIIAVMCSKLKGKYEVE